MSRARTSAKLVAVSAELWSMGETVDGIVATIGIARGTLVDIARRRRDLFPGRKSGRQKGQGFWTEAKIAKAVEIWNAGGRGEDISDRLAVGLSSVRAVISRNRDRFSRRKDMLAQTGMMHPPRAKTVKAKKPKAGPRAAKPKQAPKAPATPKPAPVAAPIGEAAPVPKAMAFHPLPGTSPASLMRVCGCRWPVECEDDRFVKAATYFCNEPRMVKADRYGRQKQSSYCATHDALSVGAGTISERQAPGFLAQQGRFEGRAA
jgi:hypothetical protein